MLNVTFRLKQIQLCKNIMRIRPMPVQCRSYQEWESKIVAPLKAIEAAIECTHLSGLQPCEVHSRPRSMCKG